MLNTRTFEDLHIELGGNYTMKHKTIIDACEIFPGEIEVLAMDDSGEELTCKIANNMQEARDMFKDIAKQYAEPLQKTFIDAGMEPGKRYTIFYLGDFGFPVAAKFTYQDMELTTYAQYSDAVKLMCKPYRKSRVYYHYFYDRSFIICKGWIDVDKSNYTDTLKDTGTVKMTQSKYGCFDARYIEDAKNYLPDIIAIHDKYETGATGKCYA